MGSNIIRDGLDIRAKKLIDKRSLNKGVPYTSIEQANLLIKYKSIGLDVWVDEGNGLKRYYYDDSMNLIESGQNGSLEFFKYVKSDYDLLEYAIRHFFIDFYHKSDLIDLYTNFELDTTDVSWSDFYNQYKTYLQNNASFDLANLFLQVDFDSMSSDEEKVHFVSNFFSYVNHIINSESTEIIDDLSELIEIDSILYDVDTDEFDRFKNFFEYFNTYTFESYWGNTYLNLFDFISTEYELPEDYQFSYLTPKEPVNIRLPELVEPNNDNDLASKKFVLDKITNIDFPSGLEIWEEKPYDIGAIVIHKNGIWLNEIESNTDEPHICNVSIPEETDSSWQPIEIQIDFIQMGLEGDFPELYNSKFIDGATPYRFDENGEIDTFIPSGSNIIYFADGVVGLFVIEGDIEIGTNYNDIVYNGHISEAPGSASVIYSHPSDLLMSCEDLLLYGFKIIGANTDQIYELTACPFTELPEPQPEPELCTWKLISSVDGINNWVDGNIHNANSLVSYQNSIWRSRIDNNESEPKIVTEVSTSWDIITDYPQINYIILNSYDSTDDMNDALELLNNKMFEDAEIIILLDNDILPITLNSGDIILNNNNIATIQETINVGEQFYYDGLGEYFYITDSIFEQLETPGICEAMIDFPVNIVISNENNVFKLISCPVTELPNPSDSIQSWDKISDITNISDYQNIKYKKGELVFKDQAIWRSESDNNNTTPLEEVTSWDEVTEWDSPQYVVVSGGNETMVQVFGPKKLSEDYVIVTYDNNTGLSQDIPTGSTTMFVNEGGFNNEEFFKVFVEHDELYQGQILDQSAFYNLMETSQSSYHFIPSVIIGMLITQTDAESLPTNTYTDTPTKVFKYNDTKLTNLPTTSNWTKISNVFNISDVKWSDISGDQKDINLKDFTDGENTTFEFNKMSQTTESSSGGWETSYKSVLDLSGFFSDITTSHYYWFHDSINSISYSFDLKKRIRFYYFVPYSSGYSPIDMTYDYENDRVYIYGVDSMGTNMYLIGWNYGDEIQNPSIVNLTPYPEDVDASGVKLKVINGLVYLYGTTDSGHIFKCNPDDEFGQFELLMNNIPTGIKKIEGGWDYENGETVYVCLTNNASIGYSNDGENWSFENNLPGSWVYKDIIWFNDLFYIIGDNTIKTSTNGVNWTDIPNNLYSLLGEQNVNSLNLYPLVTIQDNGFNYEEHFMVIANHDNHWGNSVGLLYSFDFITWYKMDYKTTPTDNDLINGIKYRGFLNISVIQKYKTIEFEGNTFDIPEYFIIANHEFNISNSDSLRTIIGNITNEISFENNINEVIVNGVTQPILNKRLHINILSKFNENINYNINELVWDDYGIWTSNSFNNGQKPSLNEWIISDLNEINVDHWGGFTYDGGYEPDKRIVAGSLTYPAGSNVAITNGFSSSYYNFGILAINLHTDLEPLTPLDDIECDELYYLIPITHFDSSHGYDENYIETYFGGLNKILGVYNNGFYHPTQLPLTNTIQPAWTLIATKVNNNTTESNISANKIRFVDTIDTTFTIPNQPLLNSVSVILNGLELDEVVDYTVDSSNIILNQPTNITDVLIIKYLYNT